MVVWFDLKKDGDKFRVHCEVESTTHSPGFVTRAFTLKKDAIIEAEKILSENWHDWAQKSVPCNPNDYILSEYSVQ